MNTRRIELFGILGMILVLSGCGPKGPENFPKTCPASLSVTRGGQPVDDVSVSLQPTQGSTAWSAGGMRNPGGGFSFTTVQGSHSVKGVPAGEYIVTVKFSKIIDMPSTEDSAERARLENEAEKTMKEAEKNAGIPVKLALPDTSPIRWKIDASGKNEWTINLDDYKEK